MVKWTFTVISSYSDSCKELVIW